MLRWKNHSFKTPTFNNLNKENHMRFKNGDFNGIQIREAPLSPRTERFFREHGATVTYPGDGYVQLSGAFSISREAVQEFLRSKQSANTSENNELDFRIITDSGSYTPQGAPNPMSGTLYKIDVTGNTKDYVIAIEATNVNYSFAGIMKIGLKGRSSNTILLLKELTKTPGHDFVIIKTDNTDSKLECIVMVVKTPANYNQLNWVANNFANNGNAAVRRFSSLNINADTQSCWNMNDEEGKHSLHSPPTPRR